MAKTFRHTLFFRVGYIINTFLLQAGVKKGNMTFLMVTREVMTSPPVQP